MKGNIKKTDTERGATAEAPDEEETPEAEEDVQDESTNKLQSEGADALPEADMPDAEMQEQEDEPNEEVAPEVDTPEEIGEEENNEDLEMSQEDGAGEP